MKIFVISDTHGKTDKAVEIYKMLKDIDLIIHLGDIFTDAKKLENQLGVAVLGVKGNMDGSYSRDEYKILDTDYGKIFLAHGHMESVKQSPQNLMYKAEALACKAAFYGHTHVPVFKIIGGMYLLNPGSLTLPAGGRKGSYAIVNTTENSIEASIVYFTPIPPETLGIQQEKNESISHESKGQGFLREILNNSDRF